jgi:hypothetical protein
MNISNNYLPKTMSRKDKEIQRKNILRTRKLYKKGAYINRKSVKSFKSKPSPHIQNAMKLYNIASVKPSRELSRKTKCSLKGLKKIVNKGAGAYYASGSRPNQTPLSWGYARLASSITGNKASIVDNHILRDECKPDSLALKLSNKAKKNQV